MIASIVIATTSSAQAKGRDSQRVQQIRQIDLAIRLFSDTMGGAPLAANGGQCAVKSNPSQVAEAEAAACVVTYNGENWSNFTSALTGGGFISAVPSDPRPTAQSGSEYALGYTYVAPLAVQYYCYQTGTCSADNDTYQLYTSLETSEAVVGNNGGASEYVNPSNFASSGGSGGGSTTFTPPNNNFALYVVPRVNGYVNTNLGSGCVIRVHWWTQSGETSGSFSCYHTEQIDPDQHIGYKVSYETNTSGLTFQSVTPPSWTYLRSYPGGPYTNPYLIFYVDFTD